MKKLLQGESVNQGFDTFAKKASNAFKNTVSKAKSAIKQQLDDFTYDKKEHDRLILKYRKDGYSYKNFSKEEKRKLGKYNEYTAED